MTIDVGWIAPIIGTLVVVLLIVVVGYWIIRLHKSGGSDE